MREKKGKEGNRRESGNTSRLGWRSINIERDVTRRDIRHVCFIALSLAR